MPSARCKEEVLRCNWLVRPLFLRVDVAVGCGQSLPRVH